MSQSIICERAFEFASRILKLSERLWGREITWELREANELLAMIVSAIRTAQSSPNRGGASVPRACRHQALMLPSRRSSILLLRRGRQRESCPYPTRFTWTV